jgi:FAD/FMN-containing dehydrogenase
MQLSISDAHVSVPDLRDRVRGRVITPDDTDYDRVRSIASGSFDLRPAAIVQVKDATDVASVVTYARETGAPLAVRSGGHSGAGHGSVDAGIVIDLRAMKGLDIDVDGRTAWAETGLTAGEYSTAAGAHGLATGFGDTGSVGIGGITVGGGIGYLVRKHGLTIDALLAAEIVTADGRIRTVDADSDPDLFWAVRGGGGNFGVVTRFRFRLVDVSRFVGGMLLLPATPEVVAGFVAEAQAAPLELSTIANVMPCPPMPFVPEDQHGRLVVMGMLAFSGDVEEGQRVLDRFRTLATPVADMTRPMAYHEIYPPEPEGDDEYHPKAIGKTMFLDGVDLPTATRIVEALESSDASMRVVQLRVLGGAMAEVPADATAFAHRSSAIMAAIAAFYEGPDRAAREAWVDALMKSIRGADRGAYVNFIGDEGEGRVRDAYPGQTWDRLAAIKARYDPTNLFRLNQNIAPAAEPST